MLRVKVACSWVLVGPPALHSAPVHPSFRGVAAISTRRSNRDGGHIQARVEAAGGHGEGMVLLQRKVMAQGMRVSGFGPRVTPGSLSITDGELDKGVHVFHAGPGRYAEGSARSLSKNLEPRGPDQTQRNPFKIFTR